VELNVKMVLDDRSPGLRVGLEGVDAIGHPHRLVVVVVDDRRARADA